MSGPRTETLKYGFYIYYPVQFKKDTVEVQGLIDSGSKINVMVPAYAKKLGLRVRKTDIGA